MQGEQHRRQGGSFLPALSFALFQTPPPLSHGDLSFLLRMGEAGGDRLQAAQEQATVCVCHHNPALRPLPVRDRDSSRTHRLSEWATLPLQAGPTRRGFRRPM